jgi:hypothetical protein
MTKDEIMEIALEAGIVPNELVRGRFVYFAELIAEAEREACVKAIEDQIGWDMDDPESTAIKAIRARGNT